MLSFPLKTIRDLSVIIMVISESHRRTEKDVKQ